MELVIRDLREADIRAVMEIERDSFPDPWPMTWFREAIRGKDQTIGAFDGESLKGYIIACMEDTSLHIGNLAVAPVARRNGAASALIAELLSRLDPAEVKTIYLEVRKSNEEAIRIYRRFGFEVTGEEKDYYMGCEDALIMTVQFNGMV